MSSKEDIARAQRIKELEPLIEAWDQWNHYTKVRVPVNDYMNYLNPLAVVPK